MCKFFLQYCLTNYATANIIKLKLAHAKKERVMIVTYPYRYPELYAELARQGRNKKELADALGITLAGLRYKQSLGTTGDFGGDEMKIASLFLDYPLHKLFGLDAPKEDSKLRPSG